MATPSVLSRYPFTAPVDIGALGGASGSRELLARGARTVVRERAWVAVRNSQRCWRHAKAPRDAMRRHEIRAARRDGSYRLSARTSTIVTTADKSKDPRQPRRLLKKRNIVRSYPTKASWIAGSHRGWVPGDRFRFNV